MVAYPDTAGYPVGGSAPLVVRIFNTGPTAVTLVGVEATDVAERVVVLGGATKPAPAPTPTPTAAPSASSTPSASASATASKSATPTPAPSATVVPRAVGDDKISVTVPAGGYALLVPGQGQYLQLSGLTKALLPGESVALTFRFSDGTTATVPVPVGLPTGSVPRGTSGVDEGNPEG
jgi:copper(I)-binding protein